MSGYNAGYIPGGSGVTSFLKLADSLETTFAGQDGKVVSVNESSGGLEFVTASAASLTNQSNVLYVSKAGDDLNNGQTIEGSFLTIQAAVDAASAGTVVQVLDSGTYDETVTLTAGVHLDAGNAKIATTAGGCLVLDGGSRVFLGDATPASGSNAVVRSSSASSSSTTVVTVQTITCTGAGLGIVNADTDATLIARANAITVATGAGIGNPAAANGTTVVDVGSITVTGNSGYGVYNHTGYLCGRIGQIVESGTPTNTVGFGQQGAGATTTIVLGKVTTDIAHACGASTTLNLYAGDVTGTELSTGTSNIFTNGAARILRETDGPTALSMAGVTDGQYLKRSGSTIVGADLAAYTGALFVGQHGDDGNAGTDPNAPFLTIGAALAAASSGDSVIVLDGGTYAESITVPAGVRLFARMAEIAPASGDAITLIPTSTAYVRKITGVTGQFCAVLPSDAGSGATHLEFDEAIVPASAVGVANLDADSQLLTRFGYISVGAGSIGIGDGSSAVGHMHFYGQDLYLDGDSAIGVVNVGTGFLVGNIEHLVDRGYATTTGILMSAAGNIDINVNRLQADTAWNISDGLLSIQCGRSDGVETVSGTGAVNAIVAGQARALRETSGPTVLTLGTVTDGEFLKRVGSTIVSAAAGGSVEGTAVLSTGETGAVKFLREDGDDSSSWVQPTLQGAYAGSASVTLTAATPIIFGYPSVGTTMNTPALKLQNTTAAVTGGSGAQYAPSLVMEGRQWSGSASKESSIHILNGNADGASAGAWITFGRTYDGGAVSELGDFGRAGYAFRVVGGPSQFYNSYVEFGTNACRIDDGSDYSTDWSTVDTFKAPASNRAMLFLHQNRTDGSGVEAFGIYWDTNSASSPAGYPLTVGFVDNSNVTQIVLGVTGHGIVLRGQDAASPPTAITAGEVAYFTNGDSGSPCLGVATGAGTTWLRCVLGAAVST